MARTILKNKPLLEAIFELRWHLPDQPSGAKADPNYKIFVGRMYDRLVDLYPVSETLPAASFPEEAVPHNVQYRLRVSEKGWPLVQFGPGVITLNSTEDYTWDVFEIRIGQLVNEFLAAYPKPNIPQIEVLILRYVDAIPFDYDNVDIFSFLKEKMKIGIEVPSNLFDGVDIDNKPAVLDLRAAFPSRNPEGSVHLRFARGTRQDQDTDILLWETIFQTTTGDIPQTTEAIVSWANKAHTITSDWFFKVIEGELQKGFE